ncbi:hypothetical protein, partial [Escherichia coli]|uniref:hypothetical protein n=1 Tax=Escherichia coli TaxID=562 RepID=UPI001BD53795
LAEGVTPYLSATLVHPPGEVAGSGFDNVKITLYGTDGKQCGAQSETTSQSQGGTAATVVAAPGEVDGEWGSPFSSGTCGAPGRYVFSAERDDAGTGQDALPVEVRVLLEPAVRDRTALPPAPLAVPMPLPAPV